MPIPRLSVTEKTVLENRTGSRLQIEGAGIESVVIRPGASIAIPVQGGELVIVRTGTKWKYQNVAFGLLPNGFMKEERFLNTFDQKVHLVVDQEGKIFVVPFDGRNWDSSNVREQQPVGYPLTPTTE